MQINNQMRKILVAWILLSVTIQSCVEAKKNSTSKATTKPGNPATKKPVNSTTVKTVKKKTKKNKKNKEGEESGAMQKPEALTQPHFNYLLVALEWLKNNVVISDPNMKNSWSIFTNILKEDKLMQNSDWQQQLILLIAQNSHLTDFIHNLNKMLHMYPWLFNGLSMMTKTQNLPGDTVELFKQWLQLSTSQLPYLGYRPGHGVQHPYHPGVYSQMYQLPNQYRMSPEVFHHQKYGQTPWYKNAQDLNQAMSNGDFDVNGCQTVNVTFNLQISGKVHCWTSVTAPRQILKNFFILAGHQNRCFNFEVQRRNSRLQPAFVTGPAREGDYIRSINGIVETSTMMWLVFQLNGQKDLELSSFLPRHNSVIVINYADSKVIKGKYLSNN